MAAAAAALQALAGEAAIVTAGKRLARALHQACAQAATAAGRQAWRTPQILPWPAWIEALWDEALYRGLPLPSRLDAHQERLLWQQILQETPEADQLLDLVATAEAAAQAWERMHAWRLDRRALAESGREDTKAFLAWAQQFEHRTEVQGWIEPARQPDSLSPYLKQLSLPSRLLLAGFDELTPQQSEFFEACRRAGVSVEELPPATDPPGRAVRVRFPDCIRELEAAARWARALLENGQAARIGVVIPNLHALRTLADLAFTRVFQPAQLLPGRRHPRRWFNISAAPPLAAQPVIRAALLVLELEPQTNPFPRVSALLRCRFVQGADRERSARARLESALRERGLWEIPTAQLCWMVHAEASACRRLRSALIGWLRLEKSLPARQSPGGWGRDFSTILARWGWPGERTPTSEEYQAVAAWRELLEQFARLDAVSQPLDRRGALALLRRLVAETPHQPESEAAPVQILGVLETPGLRFDALWIAGLDDENWPPPPHPNPFLPLELQRRHGLPHASAERELEFARRITDRLLRAAPLVVASWSEQEADRVLSPSPLIRHLPEVTPDALATSPAPDYRLQLREASREELFQDEAGPPLPEGAWQHGGTRVFQYQALCPFRAFAELRLGARRMPQPEPGPTPLERGTAVHAALESFWRQVRTQEQLCALSEQELRQQIDAAVSAALAHLERYRTESGPRLAELERIRLRKLLADWLELEKQRPPFEVIEAERTSAIELAGIRAELKIDRVDRLPDGRELILDYKTGPCSARDWEGERPAEPQLPLYAVARPQAPAGVLFAQIKTGEFRFNGLVAEPGLVPGGRQEDLPQRVTEWRWVLEQLAREFRQGRAAVDPQKGERTCRTCKLEPLCRIHEAPPRDSDHEEEQ